MKRFSPTLHLLVTVVWMIVALYMIFLYAPQEMTMGEVQRIFYQHVPAGLTAFLAYFVVFLGSVLYLWKRNNPQMRKLGGVRYFVVAFLYLCMGGTVVKILLRHLFSVKYIWVWPNVLNI